MALCSCFGPSKAQREADRLESQDARSKAADAARKRRFFSSPIEQYDKSAAGRAVRAQIAASKQSNSPSKGEPVLKQLIQSLTDQHRTLEEVKVMFETQQSLRWPKSPLFIYTVVYEATTSVIFPLIRGQVVGIDLQMQPIFRDRQHSDGSQGEGCIVPSGRSPVLASNVYEGQAHASVAQLGEV
ncbi:hypothetical protein KSP39_PZI005076 [Platanthera zijinensis]|uniref:Uncharacterized protein n=1 Tax=Platanthera zijinensis TaxID=2320716 RepID=A0AAP0BTY8_9ASPA